MSLESGSASGAFGHQRETLTTPNEGERMNILYIILIVLLVLILLGYFGRGRF